MRQETEICRIQYEKCLGKMPWTVITAATASESAPLQFLAPYANYW